MGARQFGPELGQFLQEDRLDDALGDVSLSSDPLTGNRYALAGGNPVSFIEWDGHAPIIDATGDSKTRKKIMDDFIEGQNTLAKKRNSSTGGGSGGAQAPDPDPAPAGESGGSGGSGGSSGSKDENRIAARKAKKKADKLEDIDQVAGGTKDYVDSKSKALDSIKNEAGNRYARYHQRQARRRSPVTGTGAKVLKYCKRFCGPAATYGSYRLKRAANQANGEDVETARRHAAISTAAEEAGSAAAYSVCAAGTAGAGTVFGCPFVAVGGGLAGGWYGEQANNAVDHAASRLNWATSYASTGGKTGPPPKTDLDKGWDIVKSFLP